MKAAILLAGISLTAIESAQVRASQQLPNTSPPGAAENRLEAPQVVPLEKQAEKEARRKTAAEAESWEAKLWKAIGLREEGNLDEALELADESLRIAENLYGADGALLTDSLIQIGRIYSDQKRYAEAEPFFSRSVSIDERHHGFNSPKLETGLMYLAGNFINQKQYEQADKIYLRLLAIREAASGSNHTNLVVVLRAMATLYRLQGRAQEAEAVVDRTLKLWQTPSAVVFGVDFSDIGNAHELQNLAALRVDKGDLNEANRLYLRALKLLERDLERSRKKWGTPGNGTLARMIDCLDRLARLSRKLDKDSRAKDFETRASALRMEMGGDALESPRTWGQAVFDLELPGAKAP